MKYTFVIFSLLFLFSCSNQPKVSDSRLDFKIQYQPEQKYAQTTEKYSETVIKYIGAEKPLQKLKSMGVKNPNVISRKSTIETVFNTGKLEDEKNFPVTLEYIRTTSADGKNDVPDGAVVSGECLSGNTVVFKTINAAGLDQLTKRMLLQAIQTSFSQFNFPERRMNIGEEFTSESSLTIPMEGAQVNIAIITHYKLARVSNGVANFDILQDFSMSPERLDNSFKGTGMGKGLFIYDIKNALISNYTLNTEMEMDKKLENFVFNLKTKSGYSLKTVVSKKSR